MPTLFRPVTVTGWLAFMQCFTFAKSQARICNSAMSSLRLSACRVAARLRKGNSRALPRFQLGTESSRDANKSVPKGEHELNAAFRYGAFNCIACCGDVTGVSGVRTNLGGCTVGELSVNALPQLIASHHWRLYPKTHCSCRIEPVNTADSVDCPMRKYFATAAVV
jgi:hypothetical protein